MKYTQIITEKIKKDICIAKTKVESPLDCEISVQGDSKSNVVTKFIKFDKEIKEGDKFIVDIYSQPYTANRNLELESVEYREEDFKVGNIFYKVDFNQFKEYSDSIQDINKDTSYKVIENL